MGSTKLASSVLFACCACLACGGNAGHDSTSHPDGTSGSAGSPATAGNTNSGGSESDAGSTNGAGGSANHAGSANSGGSANHAGSANSGGATNQGGSATAGQGNPSSGSGGGSTLEEYTGPGTITAAWSGFCVATFTADYAVADAFKKPLFTAHAGEQYLVTSFFAEFSANLAYLTPRGPIEFDVDVNVDETLPFTANCSPNSTASHYAVFADVSVFAELGLENKLCDLAAGSAVPRELSKIAGYSLKSNTASAAIYRIDLNAFSGRCGGSDIGFVRLPAITALGSARVIVPFQLILDAQ